MYLDVHQCVPVYLDVHQCVPVYLDVHQCVPVYLDVHQCVPVYLDVHCTCVSGYSYPYSSILCHVDSQPGDIVEKYKDKFLSYVDARAIARKLEIENVIPMNVSHKIENSGPSVANEVLFLHLRSHSSPQTLHKLCDVMTSKNGYPGMRELGRTMKKDLPSVGYVCC